MPEETFTPTGTAITDLILSIFRANNLIVTWGDRLVAGLGLTSARWQVLGAIVAADRSQPVAWLARDLGANRQNIQRIVNDLAREGFVAFQPNPHHRRAQLVVLTEKGRQTFDAALALYVPYANRFADDMEVASIQAAQDLLLTLRQRLEEAGAAGGGA